MLLCANLKVPLVGCSQTGPLNCGVCTFWSLVDVARLATQIHSHWQGIAISSPHLLIYIGHYQTVSSSIRCFCNLIGEHWCLIALICISWLLVRLCTDVYWPLGHLKAFSHLLGRKECGNRRRGGWGTAIHSHRDVWCLWSPPQASEVLY